MYDNVTFQKFRDKIVKVLKNFLTSHIHRSNQDMVERLEELIPFLEDSENIDDFNEYYGQLTLIAHRLGFPVEELIDWEIENFN
jgi:hypothetical protein